MDTNWNSKLPLKVYTAIWEHAMVHCSTIFWKKKKVAL